MGGYLRKARLAGSSTQREAARKLGVTQAYLSMVEQGTRDVSADLAVKAFEVFRLPPTVLPPGEYRPGSSAGEAHFVTVLSSLGYSGFAAAERKATTNPAGLLMAALDTDDLDARVTEALPWLPVAYPDMDWEWLGRNCRLYNRQNRLAYVVSVAVEIAQKKNDAELAGALSGRVRELEPSRLANEDTLCCASLTQAERKWLRTHRPPAAEHWNLLTDLTADHLAHAFH